MEYEVAVNIMEAIPGMPHSVLPEMGRIHMPGGQTMTEI